MMAFKGSFHSPRKVSPVESRAIPVPNMMREAFRMHLLKKQMFQRSMSMTQQQRSKHFVFLLPDHASMTKNRLQIKTFPSVQVI